MIKYFNLATVAQQVQNQYDEDGKISEEVLPSYVDDVEEYADISDFPKDGESGKIYIDAKTNAWENLESVNRNLRYTSPLIK